MRVAEETRAEVKAVLKRMMAAARSSSGTWEQDGRQTKVQLTLNENERAEQVDRESSSLSVCLFGNHSSQPKKEEKGKGRG